VFDFTSVRDISRKIVVEDDPVKIDRYLDRLYAAISKEFESTQTRNIGRIQTKRRPTRRRS
jgi:hypothetical protein